LFSGSVAVFFVIEENSDTAGTIGYSTMPTNNGPGGIRMAGASQIIGGIVVILLLNASQFIWYGGFCMSRLYADPIRGALQI